MKKLLISSLKFFSLSAMKFFLLRFNNFTQFLNTSSVIIGLEFVFSNLCLAVSENLLSLSFQKKAYFDHFLSCVSEFLERSKLVNQVSKQRVSRSIMTD